MLPSPVVSAKTVMQYHANRINEKSKEDTQRHVALTSGKHKNSHATIRCLQETRLQRFLQKKEENK